MSDYIWANPDRLKHNGSGYSDLASDLGSVIDSQAAATEGLESSDVWGEDEAGQMFRSSYMPQRHLFNLGIKQVKDGFQYTADGVQLMANTYENGENNNTERAHSLNSYITNGAGGDGGGGGDQPPGERRPGGSEEPAEVGEPALFQAQAVQAPMAPMGTAVVIVDQNGNPWPDNPDRERRILSMDEMTALGMEKPTGPYRPVATTFTEEEIRHLVRGGHKPLAPNQDGPPVTYIGPGPKVGVAPLKQAHIAPRGELLGQAPLYQGVVSGRAPQEELLGQAPLEQGRMPSQGVLPREEFASEAPMYRQLTVSQEPLTPFLPHEPTDGYVPPSGEPLTEPPAQLVRQQDDPIERVPPDSVNP